MLASVSRTELGICRSAEFFDPTDLDLLTGNKLFRNPGSANHWLKVALVGNGTTVNKAAIGA